VERITFCPACGSETPASKPRCEMCDAPLKKKTVDWTRWLRAVPIPSPLASLVALAVIAVAVAVVTAIVYR